ncbi:MAG: hypothetical protein GX295_02475, partial [Syntrophomonadaceae bacterium]|nr:hypothetical protein [Syntrophomonadaceae bacterium]
MITGNSTTGTLISEKSFALSCDHLNHANDTYKYSTYRDTGNDTNHMRLDWYRHSCEDCGASLPDIADRNGERAEAHTYSGGTCTKCDHECQHSRHGNDTYAYSIYRDTGDDTHHMRLDWYKHSCEDCGAALPNIADRNGEILEAHTFQNGRCTKCGCTEPIQETIDLIGSGFEISDNGSIQLGESINISGTVTANTSIAKVLVVIHGPNDERLGGEFFNRESFTAGTKSFDLSQAGDIPSGTGESIINQPGTYWLYLYAKTPNMANGPLLQKKTITVLEPAQVSLSSPNNGTTYRVGESIPVTVAASGVKYVQIYYKNVNNEQDWGQIGSEFIDQRNCTASWSTVGKAPGQYRIKVQGLNIPNTTPLAEDEVIVNLEGLELAVINTYPANGASNVPVESTLTVSFNNPLSYVDVNSSNNVKVTAADGSAISFDRGLGDGNILTLVPRGNLAGNTNYTVTIPANFLKDAAGNTLPQYSFSFTTGAAEQYPDLTIISPGYNETIYQSDINLTWNPVNGVTGYQLTVLDEFNGNIINAMRNEKVTKANYYLEAGKLTSGHRYKVWVGAEVNGQIISQAISYFTYVAVKPAININVPVCEPISTDFEGAAYKFYAFMNNKPDKAYILFKKADGSWLTVNEIVQNPVMAEKFTLNYHGMTAEGLYLYTKDDLVIDVGGEREFKVAAVDENGDQVGESGAGRYYYKRWVQDVQFAPQDGSGNTYRFSARVTSEPDYLVIQFKNVNGDWIPVQTIIDNKNNLEYSKFIMNKSSWEEQTYWRYEKAGVVIEVPGDRVFRITAVKRASDGSYYEDYYSLYEYQLKVAPDQRKPMVKTTDPAINATEVPLDKDIRISFDNKLRYVDVFSQSNVTLTAPDGRLVPFDRGLGDGTVLTIIPKDNLDYGTRYTVTIPGNFLKDSYGNTLDQYTLSFTTKMASPQTPDGSSSYNRTKALEYAEKYWDRMCADEKFYNTTGYVPIKGSNNFKNNYLNDGYDCAHFVSSALKAGGLDLNYINCTDLYNTVTDKYGKKTTNKAELEIGDLVFYGSKPFTHVEIITKKITTQKGIELRCASHTTAHFDDRVSSKSPTYVHLYGTKVDKGVTSMLDKESGGITFEGKDYNVYDQVHANLGLIRNSLNASYQTLSDEQLLKICKAMIQQESNGYAYSSRYEFNHDYANHTKGTYANGSLNRFLDNRHGTIKDWLDKNTVMTKRSFPYRSLINKGELRKNTKTGAYEKHSDYIDPNKNYGNYTAQTISSSSFGMYQIMVDTAIGFSEFKNTGTIQELYNPGTGTDYFIKVLINKINNAKGDLFLGVRNYNGSGKAAERYAQSVFDKAGVKRLGLSSLSYEPTTEEAADNEAPVYLGASINENGDLVMLEFDEDLIAVDLFDLKSFVTLARDGVNYAELGDFDEIKIDSNNLIIYLDESLTENHGRIKLAPGTLMDFNDNLLTSEVITDYLVADLNPPAYRDVWLNDANNIVTLLFDEDLFSNRELKPGVSISSDGINFKPLNSNDLVKLNGSSLVLNLEKALPAG